MLRPGEGRWMHDKLIMVLRMSRGIRKDYLGTKLEFRRINYSGDMAII